MLDPLKEIDYTHSYPRIAAWLRRIESGQARRTPPSSAPLFIPGMSARRVALVAAMITVFMLGFVPFRQQETVGHLLYWTTQNGPSSGLALAEELDFPMTQLVHAPHAEGKQTRFVLLLPGAADTQVKKWMESLRGDPRTATTEHVALREEIDRSLYDAFLSNLPPSLHRKGILNKVMLDLTRFNTLAAPYLTRWMDTPYTTYNLSGGTHRSAPDQSTGEYWFHITPQTKRPLAPAQERIYDEYVSTSRLLDRLDDLDSDTPRLQTARKLLKAHRDSLETLITGPFEYLPGE